MLKLINYRQAALKLWAAYETDAHLGKTLQTLGLTLSKDGLPRFWVQCRDTNFGTQLQQEILELARDGVIIPEDIFDLPPDQQAIVRAIAQKLIQEIYNYRQQFKHA